MQTTRTPIALDYAEVSVARAGARLDCRIVLRSETPGEWVGQAPDHPGCRVEARSRREAMDAIRATLARIL